MTDRIDAPLPLDENRFMTETTTSVSTTLGLDFARALQAKDAGRLTELMAPTIEFRALTPKRNWEASDPDGVVSIVLGHWFKDTDEIRVLERLESDKFADRERVAYRFRVENPEGRFLVEQQAYISQQDGRICWMRVLCSGYRPLSG